jgi:hypothetical protein
MGLELQSPVAFHLTGKRTGAELAPVTEGMLRPALFARYRDLTALRYDYPLVLLPKNAEGDAFAASLCSLVENALRADNGPEGGRLRAHALQIEREIRVLAAAAAGSLGALFDHAVRRAAPAADAKFADSVQRLRQRLPLEGEVLDCDGRTPARLLEHAWLSAQRHKLDAFGADIERLVIRLSDILRAADARSDAARTPASLRASIGAIYDDTFDFDALSRLLQGAARGGSITASRRERIEHTLAALRTQRFYPVAGGPQPYAFRFENCAGALRAFRERVPAMARLARAITVARLEIDGGYSEPRHDALFRQLDEGGLDLRDLAMFPDYLVCLNARELGSAEQGELMEILASGLPMKILVQSDDILEPPLVETGHLAFGARSRQFAHTAMGLNDVFVLQSSSSNLVRACGHVERAMRYRGPALISVFSGANPYAPGVPAYLNAAAAMESRAFPAFAYDPAAGEDWAARFTLADNPQPERDWPVHAFAYEDPEHQRVSQSLAFTLLDYVACDRRFSEHFARVPRASWDGSLVPAVECLDRDVRRLPEKLPSLPMVDEADHLHQVIVDERFIREAARCRALWRSLQELGGIGNSHVARARAEWEARAQAERAAQAKAPAPAAVPAPAVPAPAAAAGAAAAAPAAPEPAAEKPSDEPYIETPRCSSCNECIQINNRMFAYDENQQARIVDATAGTFRQLVEAAESCQVAIIHPGKPKNPGEPGLDELLKRAEAFA